MKLLVWAVGLVCLGWTCGATYEGYQVLRTVPKDDQQLKILQRLKNSKLEVDFWKEPRVVGKPVDFMVSRELSTKLQQLLQFHITGLEVTVMIPDVQQRIQQQVSTRKSGKDIDHTSYKTLAEIDKWMTDRANASNIAEVVRVATSYEGRPINTLKISSGTGQNKKAIWLDGGIHSREWISPALMNYFIDQFLSKYGSDDTITGLVDTFDWYIMPVFNVDGYVYTWTTDRLWRKTRSVNEGSSCYGCDPNRNWDFHWGEVGVSEEPCTETFPGPRAFSEIETREVAAYVKAIPNIQAYIAYHAYGQMYMLPHGFTTEEVPDYSELMAMCGKATDALEEVHGSFYVCDSLINLVGPNSGSSVDYTYGVLNIKYSLGVELRDTGENGFLLPPEEIVPTGEENMAALIQIAQHIRDNTGE